MSQVRQTSLFNEEAAQTTPRTFTIVFDGGSLGNPGKGYGSFWISERDTEYHPADRKEYGNGLTNNQAEYMTLIRALDWLRDDLGPEATTAIVRVYGDSQLVLKQVTGQWKAKHANMAALRDEVKARIPSFKEVTFTWHARANSVKRLGH